MFSSWQTSYKQCDCVCPVFVSRPCLIMSLSAANLKSNPVQFSIPGRDHELGPASVLLTRHRSELQRPSPAAPDCIWMSSLSIKGSILQFPEFLLVRGAQVSLLLAATNITVTSNVNYAWNCNKSGNWASINNSKCVQKSPGHVSPK